MTVPPGKPRRHAHAPMSRTHLYKPRLCRCKVLHLKGAGARGVAQEELAPSLEADGGGVTPEGSVAAGARPGT